MHWDSQGLLLSDKLCVIVNSRYRVYNKSCYYASWLFRRLSSHVKLAYKMQRSNRPPLGTAYSTIRNTVVGSGII